jgi:hypothetical protein
MTGSAGRSELQRACDWSAALAAALDAAAREAGDLARRVRAAWPDDYGQEWAERLATVRYSLERDADAATRLGSQIERVAGEPTGPRLGGVAARRVGDERGVRIPRLDDRGDDRGDDRVDDPPGD